MPTDFPEAGKVSAEFLESWVYPRCGAARPEVRVGPRAGVDVAIVDLPGDHAMALTTDPVSLVPALGLEESAWLTVHLLASDLTTTGRPPQYALFDLNLPPELAAQEFAEYWDHVHRFCAELGCAIVGGHTGRFAGQHATVAGGGVMITVAPRSELLTSAGGRPGDVLIVAGECAVAAVAILARSFPETIHAACGDAVVTEGQALFYRSSTVRAALAAVRAGRGRAGVTAMHDATEGGVRAALVELARASGCGARVEKRAVPVAPAARRIAAVFELDPFDVVSSGALVIAATPARTHAVLDALQTEGVAAAVVGELVPSEARSWLVDAGAQVPLTHPGVDRYWQAFNSAFAAGWK